MSFHFLTVLGSSFRYRKCKESGKVKTVKDLTKREHEKKKHKWRQYSANSYKKKNKPNVFSTSLQIRL